MRRRTPYRPACIAASLLLIWAASGCSPSGETEGGPAAGSYRIEFEDRPAPQAFQRTGLARRASANAPGGVWGVVADLRRAERARVRMVATGEEVTVPLFAGSTGGAAILLSRAAADELGIGDAPVEVTVTAVRREPLLLAARNGF